MILFSLGNTAYAVLAKDRLVDLYVAEDDGDAIRKARELAGEETLECERDLARAASMADVPVRELTELELRHRAHFSMYTHLPDILSGIAGRGVLRDFFDGAYIVEYATQKKPNKQFLFEWTLEGTIGETAVDETVAAILETGPKVLLRVMSPEDFERADAGEPIDSLAQLLVRFDRGPKDVIERLEAAYKLTYFPFPSRISPVSSVIWVPGQSTESFELSSFEVQKLSALLGVCGRHVFADERGMDWDPAEGGTLKVRLTKSSYAD